MTRRRGVEENRSCIYVVDVRDVDVGQSRRSNRGEVRGAIEARVVGTWARAALMNGGKRRRCNKWDG